MEKCQQCGRPMKQTSPLNPTWWYCRWCNQGTWRKGTGQKKESTDKERGEAK